MYQGILCASSVLLAVLPVTVWHSVRRVWWVAIGIWTVPACVMRDTTIVVWPSVLAAIFPVWLAPTPHSVSLVLPIVFWTRRPRCAAASKVTTTLVSGRVRNAITAVWNAWMAQHAHPVMQPSEGFKMAVIVAAWQAISTTDWTKYARDAITVVKTVPMLHSVRHATQLYTDNH